MGSSRDAESLTSGSRGRGWPSSRAGNGWRRVVSLECRARVSVLSGPPRHPGSRGRASHRVKWGNGQGRDADQLRDRGCHHKGPASRARHVALPCCPAAGPIPIYWSCCTRSPIYNQGRPGRHGSPPTWGAHHGHPLGWWRTIDLEPGVPTSRPASV